MCTRPLKYVAISATTASFAWCLGEGPTAPRCRRTLSPDGARLRNDERTEHSRTIFNARPPVMNCMPLRPWVPIIPGWRPSPPDVVDVVKQIADAHGGFHHPFKVGQMLGSEGFRRVRASEKCPFGHDVEQVDFALKRLAHGKRVVDGRAGHGGEVHRDENAVLSHGTKVLRPALPWCNHDSHPFILSLRSSGARFLC